MYLINVKGHPDNYLRRNTIGYDVALKSLVDDLT